MFEVGSRVRVTDPRENKRYFSAGAEGVVEGCSYDGDMVRVKFDSGVYDPDFGGIWWANTYSLALVPMTCKVSAHKAEYRARANDPATSKGVHKVNKYEQAVLNSLNGGHYEPRPEGWTGKEIAASTGLPLNSLTPRFAPLRRKGLIKDSGLRRDKQIVWVLA